MTIEPGRALGYDEEQWRDALVVVERGEVELEGTGGSRWRFCCGSILWLVGHQLVALHNRGAEPVRLVAAARRHEPPSSSSSVRSSGPWS